MTTPNTPPVAGLDPNGATPTGLPAATPQTPVPGATPTPPETGATPPPASATPATPAGDPLGAAGLAALQAEREARATAEKTLAEVQAKLDEARIAELSELEQAKERERLANTRAEQAEQALRDAAAQAQMHQAAVAVGVKAEYAAIVATEAAKLVTAGQSTEQAVAAVQLQYPIFFGTPGVGTPAPAPSVNAGAGTVTPPSNVDLTPAEREAAALFGKTPEEYHAAKHMYDKTTPGA